MVKKSKIPGLLIAYTITASKRGSFRAAGGVVGVSCRTAYRTGVVTFAPGARKSDIDDYLNEQAVKEFPLKQYDEHDYRWMQVDQFLIQACCDCNETRD